MVGLAKMRPIGKAGRNEQRKAVATTLNAISVALVVTAVLQPLFANRFNGVITLLSTVAFLVSQLVLHYVLSGVED
jgi:isoprenylcysteine carboxyl methyltransferase (ICMT) family protein YpbQ